MVKNNKKNTFLRKKSSSPLGVHSKRVKKGRTSFSRRNLTGNLGKNQLDITNFFGASRHLDSKEFKKRDEEEKKPWKEDFHQEEAIKPPALLRAQK